MAGRALPASALVAGGRGAWAIGARGLLAAALVAGVGCGPREDVVAAAPIDAAAAEAARDAGPPPDAGAAEADPATPARLPTDPATQALVTAWLESQNQRDFAAYQALYHPRFRGVRRAGGVTTRFDRAGWLRDRASGFRTSPRLAISDLAVYQGTPHRQVFAAVRTQLGGHAVERTLDLVVAEDGADLRILYEELLDPRALPAGMGPPPLTGLPVAPAGDRDHWFGYDRAWSLQTMRVAPIVGADVLVARVVLPSPPRDAVVVEARFDPAAGGVRAARVEAPLPAGSPLAALAGQAIVVLDRGLVERCRGTLGPLVVRAAGTFTDAVREDALAAATWRLGPAVVAAALRAPCTGAYARGVAAAPIERALDHGALPVGLLRSVARDLAVDGLAVDVGAELGAERAGFALYTRSRPAACTAPAHASRVLYTLVRERRRWQLARVAELAGDSPSMIVADVDGDRALDAILAGGAYVGGQLEVWHPSLAWPWPAGAVCR